MTSTSATPPDRSFERLWTSRAQRLRRFARRLSVCPDDAEDLIQDALLLGYKSFRTYDASRSFDNWMMAIIQNRARQIVRRRRSLVLVRLDHIADQYEGADEQAISPLRTMLDSEAMAWAIGQLLPREREIVRQIALLGLDYRAIADSLGVPLGTVRSRIFRTRESLKTILGDALY